MNIITFYCESISPLFIGNALKNEAELRPPAIKASLRFWWRALHPHLTLEELKEQEAKIFGGSFNNGKEINNYPSTFNFNYIDYEINNINDSFLDEREDKVDRRKNRIKKKSFLPENEFSISIAIIDSTKQEQIISLFKLASYLGGIGNRARRGSGAWKINSIDIKDTNSTDIEPNNNVRYSLEDLLSNLKVINNNYNIQNDHIEISNEVDLTIKKYPYVKKIEIGICYGTQKALREKIMRTANHFHSNELFQKYLGNAVPNNRLSSPIYVSIIKDQEKIKPIICTLWCN